MTYPVTMAARLSDIIIMLDAPDVYSRSYIASVCRATLATIGTPNDAREVLEKAREEIVLTIAFLGRDTGTDRIEGTINGLIERLAKADATVLKALAAVPDETANKS